MDSRPVLRFERNGPNIARVDIIDGNKGEGSGGVPIGGVRVSGKDEFTLELPCCPELDGLTGGSIKEVIEKVDATVATGGVTFRLEGVAGI